MAARPTVIVVGGGPAAIAAARCIRKAATRQGDGESTLRVLVVVPGGVSDYLPGTFTVATGDAPAARYRTPIAIRGVEVIPAPAEALRPGAVRVDGAWIEAQAVIAAPGLALEPVEGAGPTVVGFWDPSGAEVASQQITSLERGVLQIVIARLPYRCPPAPYGLAMRLAQRAKRLGLSLEVRLFSPEGHPLTGLGSRVGDALLDGCSEAGVEVHLGARLDLDMVAAGRLLGEEGSSSTPSGASRQTAALTIVVPAHRATPLLRDLADDSVLVPVGDRFATEVPGVYVAGDAAMSPYPRATDPAAVSGVIAAQTALVQLGYVEEEPLRTPEPDCLVDHGEGRYGRIRIAYPDGPPPAGAPAVSLEAPGLSLGLAFDDAHRRWQQLRRDVA